VLTASIIRAISIKRRKHQPDYRAQQPIRQPPSQSPPWDHKILLNKIICLSFYIADEKNSEANCDTPALAHTALIVVNVIIIITGGADGNLQSPCPTQQDDDRPVRREGSRCRTASPCESLISFTSLIDSRPSPGDYTSKRKGKMWEGEETERNREEQEEEKNICTGISKYWFRLMRKREYRPTKSQLFWRDGLRLNNQESLAKAAVPPEKDRPRIHSYTI
jgi:hypothetical protein